MLSSIYQAAELLRRSDRIVALTGAGISTPSGIPDFRSPDSGLWKAADPLEIASIWAFHNHPERFYKWIRPVWEKIQVAQPNPAHHILAQMEEQSQLACVITQNIDSLHQRAGSRHVFELHGHARSACCLGCGNEVAAEVLFPAISSAGAPPRCTECNDLLKPNVILFGEPLPYSALSAAQHEALNCDAMLVIGTSLEVMPAADLPLLARRRGARVILLNRTPTPLDDQLDVVVHTDIVTGLQQIWQAIGSSSITLR